MVIKLFLSLDNRMRRLGGEYEEGLRPLSEAEFGGE